MSYRTLGHSGLQVSTLTLGTMMFGEQTSTEDSLRIIDKAWDQGINFIDTADVYTNGRSEEIVGEAIARHRQEWVLATKVGFGPPDGMPNRSGLSRKHIFNGIEASLTRLGTDYLDIYYLHREDHNTPLHVTVSAIGDLIRQGKIRYWGLSNYRGWRIAEVIRIADSLGIDRPVISQPLYNIVNRQAETEQITAAQNYGLGVVPFSPPGPRRAQRQVRAGRGAGRQQPCRTPGQTHPGNRMAGRIPAHCPADPAIHPGPRRGHRRVRHRLGAEQQRRDLGHRRAAHRGAVGFVYQGAIGEDQRRR